MNCYAKGAFIATVVACGVSAFAPTAFTTRTSRTSGSARYGTIVTGSKGKAATSKEEDIMLTVQIIMDHEARSTAVSKDQFVNQTGEAAKTEEEVVAEPSDVAITSIRLSTQKISMTDSAAFPSPEEVERIIQKDRDPVIRNLQITQGYHDLSRALYERTGQVWINWCSLGCWASKTAGKYIRSDEIPKVFRNILIDNGPFAEVAHHESGDLNFFDVAEGIVGDISVYLMEGNRVVFQELAGTFSLFLTELGDDKEFDEAHLQALQDKFKDGMPEPDSAKINDDGTIDSNQEGGQQLLKEMIAAYYKAMFETDPKKRGELMLLGNSFGGRHEQTRLQTYIKGSLDAPVEDMMRARALEEARAVAEGDHLNNLEKWVDAKLPTVGKMAANLWEEFSTIALMSLKLPDGVLHLSQPIKHSDGAPLLPKELEQIENDELRETLVMYDALDPKISKNPLEKLESYLRCLFGFKQDKTEGALKVGALDWTDLDQRMTYILTLFRSRADDDDLVCEPFTREQRDSIMNNQVPDGKL